MSLVLRGGDVLTPGGLVRGDVLIEGETITGIVGDSSGVQAEERVDVSGKVVIPGGIDTHTHLRDPGYTHKEDITTGTRAAAAGGYTTVVGMPNVNPATNTVARYQEALELYASKSLVDFNHNPAPTILEEIPGLAENGALGFKVYMIEDTGRDYPHIPGTGVHDHGRLLEIAEAVERTGRPLMVHPHDQELMNTIEARFWARGETDPVAYAHAYATHECIVWDSATWLLIRLQEATGVHMHVLHTKTPRMVNLLREAKERGQQVTSELNPAAVFLNCDIDTIERLGPYALGTWTGPAGAPPLWDAMNDGTIDVIGTDHAPHSKDEKEPGWSNMWEAHGGVPQIQDCLSLLLTEVKRGRISLERAVELSATAPARIFGLYPKKGVIQPGADADLVVVDLEQRRTIRQEDVLSKCGWTAFDGVEVEATPIHTLVRGNFVMRDEVVVGKPGGGRQAVPVATA